MSKEFEDRLAGRGVVWETSARLVKGNHHAPFSQEVARRAILLTCPQKVGFRYGEPWRRQMQPTTELDEHLPQGRNAMSHTCERNLRWERYET